MREYVVKVSSLGSRGTGVVVGRGLVATALHVVAERRPDGMTPHADTCKLEFARLNNQSGTWEQRAATARILPHAWDLDDDWALLAFDPAELEGWDLQPAGLAHAREEAVAGRRLLWFSWGFPEAHPRLGMETGGHIRTVRAPLDAMTPGRDPVTAIQLYSEEAAAALGMPVKGLSGAPVVVEGNVVGLLRYSLLQPALTGEQRRNQAGTLYATPIERLRDPGGLFRWEDSDRLPPLGPSERLPQEPFRFLERYKREDFRIFFGRGSDIRQFISDLRRTDLPPVGLLFGPMGAGKSSFLHAGIESRLADRKLQVEPRSTDGLLATWRVLREKVGDAADLPVIDQLEEAWTVGGGDNEFADLLRDIADWMGARGPRAGIQLFLSFREDRLSSVEDELRKHGMRWHPFPLRHLDSHGLLETMTGFEQNPAIRDHYRIAFRPQGLQQTIVDAVNTGSPGAVAPVLQVLLSRLWARARSRAEAEGIPVREILQTDLELEQAAAAGLRDFLEKQLFAVEANCPGSFQTGFALEILSEYTTPSGTARSQALQELAGRYPPNTLIPISHLVEELAANRLLFRDCPASHRLVHDSLAPVVHYVLAKSNRPAQRARRNLENRSLDWADGRIGQPLDKADLATVDAGMSVTRVQTPSEQRLVEASRDAMARRATASLFLRLGLVLAITTVLAVGLWAFLASQRGAEARNAAAQRLAANWFRVGTSAFEDEHNVLVALLAVSHAVSVAPNNDPNRPLYFARLLALAPYAPEFVMNIGSVGRATLDVDHHLLVLQREDGAIESWDTQSKKRLPSPIPVEISGGLRYSDPPVIREDGKYAAIVTPTQYSVGDLRLLVWELSSGRVALNEGTDLKFSPVFGPSDWIAQKTWQGLRTWKISPAGFARSPDLPRLFGRTEPKDTAWLAPRGVPRIAVAPSEGGLHLVDLAAPSLKAGPFLQEFELKWAGWTSDGRLIAIGQRGSAFQGYYCSQEGCAESSSADLSADPDASGLHIDRCGTVFGHAFVLDNDDRSIRLPKWPRLGRLCLVGKSLVGMTETSVSQWRTYSSIVECEVEAGECKSTGNLERRIPGGAIAVEWTKDRRQVFTLSTTGTLLRWPSTVRPPTATPLERPSEGKNVVDTWPRFARDGSLVAVATADHAGVDVQIRSLSSGTPVSARVAFPPDERLPASIGDDPHFFEGRLRVVRFSDDAARLLIGVQGRQALLSVIDSKSGTVTDLPRKPLGGIEDAFLLKSSAMVVLASRLVEQIPLDGAGASLQCSIPSAATFSGFGRHGELLLRQANRIEVWTVKTCSAFASVAAAGGGSEELALALLREADDIQGEDGRLVVRFGPREIAISSAKDGMLALSTGSTLLRIPIPTDDRSWYRVVSVSPDARRVILVHDRLEQASDTGVWDLESGLRIDVGTPTEIEGKGWWSTSLASNSAWGAGFTSGGEGLALLSRSGHLVDVPIGPAQLEESAWMSDIDVGLSGLRLRDDGGFYSPPNAAEQMRAFRLQVEEAGQQGDRAAAALLKALERQR